MTPRLPLRALQAFDAVMRTGSMVRAGEVLGVTHGAVSRQILALQDRLGLILFEGPRNARRPTAQAESLWEEVRPAFDRLAVAVATHTPARQTVRVSCLSTLVGRWLIPRLAGWEHGPDIALSESYADLDRSLEGADLAIRMLAADTIIPIGLSATPFMTNRVGPVVAAGVDPTTARRLISRSHPQAIDDWIARSGGPLGVADPPLLFDHQQTMIEACLAGLGVCVTQQPLIVMDLASGRLFAPHGFHSDGAVFAIFHRTGDLNVPARRFITWLTAQGED